MSKIVIEAFSDYPALLATAAICLVLIGLLIKILNYKIEGKKVSLQHIAIADSVLKPNLNKADKKQKYLTERLFESMYKYRLSYSEIVILLNCNNQSAAIRLFLQSEYFLKLSNSERSFVLKEKENKFSIHGRSVFATGVLLFLRYVAIGFLSIFLFVAAYYFFPNFSGDVQAEQITNLAVSVLLFFFGLLGSILAFRTLLIMDSKKNAVNFIQEHFPENLAHE
jgi:hypothetical protein